VRAGGAIVVKDAEFTPEFVATALPRLLRDPARIALMAAAIATTGRRDGADRMVDLVLEARDAGARVASNA
jgi:UDP-N-acetylglucosamine--N-acetylmuramyl-(pentapeptide) pyrophosphoryl-undecaprenol N-acetylglucosamine transferase